MRANIKPGRSSSAYRPKHNQNTPLRQYQTIWSTTTHLWLQGHWSWSRPCCNELNPAKRKRRKIRQEKRCGVWRLLIFRIEDLALSQNWTYSATSGSSSGSAPSKVSCRARFCCSSMSPTATKGKVFKCGVDVLGGRCLSNDSTSSSPHPHPQKKEVPGFFRATLPWVQEL